MFHNDHLTVIVRCHLTIFNIQLSFILLQQKAKCKLFITDMCKSAYRVPTVCTPAMSRVQSSNVLRVQNGFVLSVQRRCTVSTTVMYCEYNSVVPATKLLFAGNKGTFTCCLFQKKWLYLHRQVKRKCTEAVLSPGTLLKPCTIIKRLELVEQDPL